MPKNFIKKLVSFNDLDSPTASGVEFLISKLKETFIDNDESGLNVSKNNSIAHPFYKKCGWELIGDHELYTTAYVFRKEL